MESSLLIAPFVTGLQHNKASWLCAPDSFQEMINARIEHGYIAPKRGYRILFSLPSNLPVTGFRNNSPETLIWDTKNLWKMINGNVDATPVNSSPLFASSFSFVKHLEMMNMQGEAKVYFTAGFPKNNNVDGLWVYQSPNSITSFSPEISEGSIVGAKALGSLRGRLLLFGTYESVNQVITYHPTRVRWSAAGSPNIFTESTGGGYADAAISGEIVGVAPLQNIMVVGFTEGLWALDSTWDVDKPFVWRRCDENVRCFSEGSLISFPLEIKIVGPRGILSTDSRQVERIDDLIPLYVSQNMDLSQGSKFFGLRDYLYQTLWYVYRYSDQSSTTYRALIRDERTQSYSTYTVPFSILGYGRDSWSYRCSDFTEQENRYFTVSSQIGVKIKDYRNQGNDLFLGGDDEGNVYKIDEGYFSPEPTISFLKTAEWNPFVSEGKQSRFLYLDLFVDVVKNQTVTVSFFKDSQDAPYKTATISLLPLRGLIGEISQVITGETTELVVPSHGLETPTPLYIYEVRGMSRLNSLEGIIGVPVSPQGIQLPISSIDWEPYAGGGIVSLYPLTQDKIWKRVYAGGTGFTHSVSLEVKGYETTYFKLHALKPRFISRGKRLV